MQQFAGSWFQYLFYLLIAANLAALVVGVAMLAEPERCKRWFGTEHKPRSVRQSIKRLEVAHDADTPLLSRPGLLGSMLLVAAVLILVKGSHFVSAIDVPQGGKLLARLFGAPVATPAVWESAWLSLVIFIALGALVAAAVGVVVLTRPDWIRQWSRVSNRWVSSRQATRRVSQAGAYYGADRLLQQYPRPFGAIVTIVSLYTLAVMIGFLSGS